jgi:hypothetical protein
MKLLNQASSEGSDDCFQPHVAAWSSTLQAWYRRAGRALVSQRVSLPSIPASSGHRIERAMLQIAEHGSVLDEDTTTTAGGDTNNNSALQSPKLTKKALQSLELGGTDSHTATSGTSSQRGGRGSGSAVPYDLQTKPFYQVYTLH